MSKAYHAHKNFTFKEMMNLMSYGTKHPETLSHVQRITRLYRLFISQIPLFTPLTDPAFVKSKLLN